jgi:hypothetical protein
MDQNTAISLGVALAVALVLFIGLAVFAWRAMGRLSERLFAGGGSYLGSFAQPQPIQPQSQSGRCECPPVGKGECVPARVGDPEDIPHAIYGLAGGECCGGDGRMTRKQLQSLVNEVNRVADEDDRKRLFDRLGNVINRG